MQYVSLENKIYLLKGMGIRISIELGIIWYKISPLNAVVTDPHMFLITINFEVPPSGSGYDEPYVVCYEQMLYNAQLTFHTYAQLSQGEYIPFSKF